MKKNKYELHRTLFNTRVLNKVTPEEIPVGNHEAVETLFKDMQTLEFVNEVMLGDAYPASEGYGEVILTEEWAESFAKAVNEKPGFLYAKGHEDAETWFARAIASGYIVGAKVEDGRLLLRNRLLERTSPDNQELMLQTLNEIKAGLLSTSTGDYQKRRVEFDENGEMTQYAIESVKNQTNALVEHDMHASEATIISSNFKLAYYDENGNTVSKSTAEDGAKFKEGELTMNEHFEAIKKSALKDEVVAEKLGLEIATEEMRTQLKEVKELEAKVGNLKEFINKSLAEKEAVFKTLKENALKEAFKEDEVREAAETLFRLDGGTTEEIETEITRLKELSGIKKMQTVIASSINHEPNAVIEAEVRQEQDVEA